MRPWILVATLLIVAGAGSYLLYHDYITSHSPSVIQENPLASTTPCVASDINTLRACAEHLGPTTITFVTPTLTFATNTPPILVASNKIIQGPVVISAPGRIFDLVGVHTIVIRDISFTTSPGGLNSAGLVCPDPTLPDTTDTELSGCGGAVVIQGSNVPSRQKSLVVENGQDSSDITVDHNSFRYCGDKCITVSNGSATNALGRWYGSTGITISNNVFSDSFYAVLATIANNTPGGARAAVTGSTATCEAAAAKGILPLQHIDVYGNFFDHIRRRSIRAAYCTTQVYEFNNVINDFGMPLSGFPPGTSCLTSDAYGFGPSSIYGAQLYLQNNYISAWSDDPNGCKAAVNVSASQGIDPNTLGYVAETGDLFVNGAFGTTSEPERVFTPQPSRPLLPTAEVYAAVTQTAGPSH